MNFGPEYADAYDALYQTKDYVAETQFVLHQLRDQIPPGGELLDLGCGTGLHAVEMARSGFSVTGVDQSSDMIARAIGRKDNLPADIGSALRFQVGDMRTVLLDRTFDAVVSLFHVLCYMIDDVMLEQALATMRCHLQPGGALLFDFWYADAVLSEPPEPRERVIEQGDRRIHRITSPKWDPERSLVHITYDMLVTRGDDPQIHQQETHTIRYFSRPELSAHLARAGFSVLRFGEWITDAVPSNRSFGVYAIAKAV